MRIERYNNRTLLTKEEVAEILVVSIRKVEYMIQEGALPIIPIGHRTVRIKKIDLIEYIRSVEKNHAIPAHSR